MKRTVAIFLAVAILFSFCSCKIENPSEENTEPAVTVVDENLSNVPYELELVISEKETVDSYNKHYVEKPETSGYILKRYTGSEKNITVPSNINNIDVVKIGNGCFSNNTNIVSVNIPRTVLDIDNFAFYCCTNLSEVKISNKTERIGASAFAGCTALTNITIPEDITVIDVCAFADCTALTSISFKGKEELEIKASAFSNTGFENFIFPSNVTELAPAVLANCKNLQKVVVHAMVDKMYKTSFKNSSKAKLYVKENSYAHKFAVDNRIKYQT